MTPLAPLRVFLKSIDLDLLPKYLIDTKKINLNKFINEILNKNISYWKGNKDTKLKIFKKLKKT